jgi:hypothetical protein
MTKRKVILFFSCEPGGAEVLIPVIKLVSQVTSYHIIVLSYGLGAERFRQKEVEYIEISRVVKNDSAIINAYRPNLIITSATSLPDRDMSEKYRWHNSRLAGIPTIAFLDQWQNYVLRFSGAAADERLAYIPNYINCINAIGKSDMIHEGFCTHGLVQFGHPYLTSLKILATQVDVFEIRKALGIEPAHRLILFASEAIQEHFGYTRGYDQYDALRMFMDLMSQSTKDVRPLIKLHPKDELEGYVQVLRDYPELHALIITNEVRPVECIQIADEVYGMTSIILIEAYVLGKKVVSLQPRLKVEDPMVLSRLGYIQKITDPNLSVIDETLFPNIQMSIQFDFSFREQDFLFFLDAILIKTI